MRYLGIDYGTKKLGLALSDEAGTMGFPHRIVPNDAGTLDVVLGILEKEHVGAIVMGESLSLSGEANPVANEARAFADTLHARTNLPIFFELEMFTTQEARRGMEGERNAVTGNVDASAAALILTSYLSRNHE